MPEGTMHSHGLVEVSAAAGLVFEGDQTLRKVADSLEAEEWVLAVAKGRSATLGKREQQGALLVEMALLQDKERPP